MIRFFKEAWLVLVVMVGCGLGLAAVEKSLEGRIAEANKQAIMGSISEVISADPAAIAIDEIKLSDDAKIFRVRDKQSKKTVGWAVPAKADKPDPSYSGELEMMIGLDVTGSKIVGLKITKSAETPGLGQQVEAAKFRDQFTGKPADAELKLTKTNEPGQIQSCTGATISSKAVVGAVSRQLAAVQKKIAELSNQ